MRISMDRVPTTDDNLTNDEGARASCVRQVGPRRSGDLDDVILEAGEEAQNLTLLTSRYL